MLLHQTAINLLLIQRHWQGIQNAAGQDKTLLSQSYSWSSGWLSKIILQLLDISANLTFKKPFRFITPFCLAVKGFMLFTCLCVAAGFYVSQYPTVQILAATKKSVLKCEYNIIKDTPALSVILKLHFQRQDAIKETKTSKMFQLFSRGYTLPLLEKQPHQGPQKHRLLVREKHETILIKFSRRLLESCRWQTF